MRKDKFTFGSAGMIHELEMAMDRVGGWTPTMVKDICKGDTLGAIRDILLKRADIQYLPLVIDRASPYQPPQDLSIEWQSDQSLKLTRIDPSKITLSRILGRSSIIVGPSPSETDFIPLDAGILRAFLENQYLVPENWKKRRNEHFATRVCFGGTKLSSSRGLKSAPHRGEGSIFALYWDSSWLQWKQERVFLDDEQLPEYYLFATLSSRNVKMF